GGQADHPRLGQPRDRRRPRPGRLGGGHDQRRRGPHPEGAGQGDQGAGGEGSRRPTGAERHLGIVVLDHQPGPIRLLHVGSDHQRPQRRHPVHRDGDQAADGGDPARRHRHDRHQAHRLPRAHLGPPGVRRVDGGALPATHQAEPGGLGLGSGTDVIPAANRARVRWLGRLPYQEAWDLQRALWEGRITGRAEDDYLLLLEHPHVYTVGRNGDGSHLRVAPGDLPALGAELHHVDRGGDITYHGPGQLVGYPIFAVPALTGGFDAVGHVRRIEEMLIATLADFGVAAWAEPGYTGVWTRLGKVAAIGVRVRQGVSSHGFALNVDPDLSFFANIVPCGIADRPVTSLQALLDEPPTMEEVVSALIPRAHAVFGYDDMEVQLGAFTRGQGRRFDVDDMVAAGVFSSRRRDEVPVAIRGILAGEPERPEWMRVRANTSSDGYRDLKGLMRGLGLHTVCEEAGCPNIYECWEAGTATLMLLGDTCTRACSFCDVLTGKPGEVDWDEPARAADAVAGMGALRRHR
ncbi:MAG: lipoyl(octanoyl) transferase LipB, partial [Actinobacteria bacterium]